MIQCTHCGRVFEGHQTECPSCFKPTREIGEELGDRSGAFSGEGPSGPTPQAGFRSEDFSGPMAPIARFTNAAEAGYFSHELMQEHGIPCSVTIEENFDAISGYWSARFVLSAPEEEADTAAEALKRLVEQTELDELEAAALGYGEYPDEASSTVSAWNSANGIDGLREGRTAAGTVPSDGDVFEIPGEEITVEDSGVNWVPIVLTLAAGSVAFWGVKRLQDQPRLEEPHRPAGAQHEDLWDHLATPSRPWVQQMDNGQGRRQLWIDPEDEAAILREDADGDGLFENEIRIPRAAGKR